MKILITAGPTREYLDPVRYITNGSSGQMGFAVATAAVAAGHEVTLLAGPVSLDPPAGVTVEPFVTVTDLQNALVRDFSACDVLIMAAAVGDFTPAETLDRKRSRRDGPFSVTLVPTPDLVSAIAAGKRADQRVVTFAVEDGPRGEMEAKALAELQAKHGDLVVLNPPAAMGAADSKAAILSPDGVLLPWAERPKSALADAIIRLATM